METRKKSDVRNITLLFEDGERTYSVGSTRNKADVLEWAAKVYPAAKVMSVEVGIIIKGKLNWEWEAE